MQATIVIRAYQFRPTILMVRIWPLSKIVTHVPPYQECLKWTTNSR